MFSDPERRHETEITIIQGLKQVFIFCSVAYDEFIIMHHYQCSSLGSELFINLCYLGVWLEKAIPIH